MDRFIRPPEQPHTPRPSEAMIDEWEESKGMKLPEDYRYFMTTHNGGFIFPEAFPAGYPEGHVYYSEFDPDDYIEFLSGWVGFVERNSFSSQSWNIGEFVTIGAATSGDLLLRLAREDFGSVHLWSRTNQPWDDDANPGITGRVAPSFRAFIVDVLHEGEGPSSRWDHPVRFKDVQKIEFPNP